MCKSPRFSDWGDSGTPNPPSRWPLKAAQMFLERPKRWSDLSGVTQLIEQLELNPELQSHSSEFGCPYWAPGPVWHCPSLGCLLGAGVATLLLRTGRPTQGRWLSPEYCVRKCQHWGWIWDPPNGPSGVPPPRFFPFYSFVKLFSLAHAKWEREILSPSPGLWFASPGYFIPCQGALERQGWPEGPGCPQGTRHKAAGLGTQPDKLSAFLQRKILTRYWKQSFSCHLPLTVHLWPWHFTNSVYMFKLYAFKIAYEKAYIVANDRSPHSLIFFLILFIIIS